MRYRHLVEVITREVPESRSRLYDGPDAADAMAAWSEAIGKGYEYVTIESIAMPGVPS